MLHVISKSLVIYWRKLILLLIIEILSAFWNPLGPLSDMIYSN